MLSQEQLDAMSKFYRTLPADEEGRPQEVIYSSMAVRGDILKLIQTVRAKDAEIERMKHDYAVIKKAHEISVDDLISASNDYEIAVEALEWYAERDKHEIKRRIGGDFAPITLDKGKLAREALERINGKED